MIFLHSSQCFPTSITWFSFAVTWLTVQLSTNDIECNTPSPKNKKHGSGLGISWKINLKDVPLPESEVWITITVQTRSTLQPIFYILQSGRWNWTKKMQILSIRAHYTDGDLLKYRRHTHLRWFSNCSLSSTLRFCPSTVWKKNRKEIIIDSFFEIHLEEWCLHWYKKIVKLNCSLTCVCKGIA